MTFEEKLNQRIDQAQVAVDNKQKERQDKLLENDNFIEAQRNLREKNKELKALNNTIDALNSIPAFKAKNGSKFSVNVFPLNGFPVGLDRVLGIIAASRSAFVDELSLQYETICGISMIELTLAREALGSPAYYNSNTAKVVDEIPGNIDALKPFIQSIGLKLGIREFDLTVDESTVNLYFLRSKLKAETAQAEAEKTAILNETSNFKLAD